jgi:hypothetical protein
MDIITGDGEDYIIRESYKNKTSFESVYDFLRDVSVRGDGGESSDEDVSQASASAGRGIETPSQGALFCFLKVITKHKNVVAQDRHGYSWKMEAMCVLLFQSQVGVYDSQLVSEALQHHPLGPWEIVPINLPPLMMVMCQCAV